MSGRGIRRFAVVIAAAGVLLAACGGNEHELVGATREPEPAVDAVALPDVSDGGTPFEMRADDGELLVVYFGYTNCPDVCPTTLSDLRMALRQLDDDEAAKVDVAMVTIDPARDTEILTDYVQSFVPDAHALATSEPTDLRAAADPFGVSYVVQESESGEIEVAHSSQLFLVDDTGTLVLTWLFGTTSDDIAADLDHLIDGLEA